MAATGNRSLAPIVGALGREFVPTATDGELLDQFLTRRDEAAFSALVRRHGPMVLAVCRRALDGTADADDAFQATFLVLLRKGDALKSRPTVGDWLHGVARRTALKARAAAARRHARERAAARAEGGPAPERNDWLPWLDEEIGRLPARFREPLVLCDLEGMTRGEAARALGWPEGSVAGCLARARELLAKRLLRRAAAVGGGIGAGLADGTVQAVPPQLEAAVRAAVFGSPPQAVLALVGAASRTKAVVTLALSTLVLAVGGLFAARQLLPDDRLPPHPNGKQFRADADTRPVADLLPPAPKSGEFQVAIDRPAPPPVAERKHEPEWTEKKVRHDPGVIVSAVAYSPIPRAAAAIGANGVDLPAGGETFATVGSNGIIYFWDRATFTKLKDSIWLPGTGPACLAYSPDGKSIAAGDSDGLVLYDATTGKKVKAFSLGLLKQPAYAVGFSPDGKSLVQSSGHAYATHSVATGAGTENPGPATLPEGVPEIPPAGLAWGPDGKLFARILNTPPGVEPGITKWRVRVEGGRAVPKDLTGHDKMITAIAWSKDGRVIASGDIDGGVVLWDGRTYKERRRAKLRAAEQSLVVHALAFAPDGKTLAVAAEALGGGEGAIRVLLLDPATGKELHRLTRAWTVPVVSLAWSRDGHTLVTASGLRPGDGRMLTAEQKKSGGEIVVWERKP